jgi:site-specific recombinase XerD
MNTVKDLYDFIETATRNRKYPSSTAQGLKVALNLFSSELNDEERASIDTIKKNIDQIYQSVFTKNKNFTATSLAVYRSRLLKTINDYEQYGQDPSKMANWNPKVVIRGPRQPAATQKVTDEQEGSDKGEPDKDRQQPVSANMHRLELALRPNTKFVIIVPQDLKQAEADTLSSILNSLIVGGETND